MALDDSESGVAVSADGRLVARAFQRNVQVLDLATGDNVGPPLAADIPAMDVVAQLAFSPDGGRLRARTQYGYWLQWPIASNVRPLPELAAVLGRRGDTGKQSSPIAPLRVARTALRARDPGPWPRPEPRPSPPIARWLDGLPIPARAPGTSPLLLDLTAAYDFGPETVLNTYFSVLPSLRPRPVGVQRIAGVDYDVRGMVQVGAPNPTNAGIPVPAVPVAALHLLMTVSTPIPIPDVETVAQVRLHYRDGSQAVLPIRTQREVPGYSPHDRPVPLAWSQYRGVGSMAARSGAGDLVLSAPRLVNPHPERLIRSLDLELGETGAVNTSLCLGITVEPVISDAVLRNTSRQGATPEPSSIATSSIARRSP